MGLRLIPFYASLLGESVTIGFNATQSHVLVYGAIEAHHMGPKGCIASNAALARDVGLSAGRTANIISDLASACWVDVKLNAKNQRESITPMLGLHANVNPPSRRSEAPLHADVNIDNSKRKQLDNSAGAVSPTTPSETFGEKEEKGSAQKEESDEPPTILALYYRVITKYKLPAWHKQVPQRAKDLEAEMGYDAAAKYLNLLHMHVDYQAIEGEFKPELAHANDIYGKRMKIMAFLKERTATLPPSKRSWQPPTEEEAAAEERKRRLSNARFMGNEEAATYLTAVMPAEEVADWLASRGTK